MNETIKMKVTILLNLVKSGKNPDEAAKLIGYKNYDSMRASVGIENGCDLYESIKAGFPVGYVKKKFHKKERTVEDSQVKALREDYESLKENYKILIGDHDELYNDYIRLLKAANELSTGVKAAVENYFGTFKKKCGDEE